MKLQFTSRTIAANSESQGVLSGGVMANDEFWTTVMDRDGQESPPKRFGAVRAALLFGTAAIALAAILTPIVADRGPSARVAWAPDQYDNITTGSIPSRSVTTSYTVRKSILQDNPGALCIIRSNGIKSGDC
tara:strand:- start:1028 stop:1423 length:396 start_codon:yes stop_codon:yes gene_type:complete